MQPAKKYPPNVIGRIKNPLSSSISIEDIEDSYGETSDTDIVLKG